MGSEKKIPKLEKINELLEKINLEKDLEERLKKRLDKAGIYFHIFTRKKDPKSLCEKLIRKDEKYRKENRKLQDLIGIRIVLYYADDIPICEKIVESIFHVRREDSEKDRPEIDEFKPVRLNLVCDIPEGEDRFVERIPQELWNDYRIDKTFEIQIRTVLSEGWHEVEHDVRYKHTEEWENPRYYDFNRKLNGINATLEVCDNTIVSILEALAYQCYKEGKLAEMFRYKLRTRIKDEEIKPELLEQLTDDKELLKKFFRLEREELLYALASSMHVIPLNLSNIIYFCNALQINDEHINETLPLIIKESVEQCKEEEKNAISI